MERANVNDQVLELSGGDRFTDVRQLSEKHQQDHGCGLHNAGGPVMSTVASIAQLAGAQRILDLGSGLGYSTLWLADAAGPSCHVTGIDADPEHTEAATMIAAQRGFSDRVAYVTGKAAEVLPTLTGTYDLIHDDAWFADRPTHLDAALDLLRPGGTMTMANWFLLFDALTNAQQEAWEHFAGPAWQRRTLDYAEHLVNRTDISMNWITSPPVGIATKLNAPSVDLSMPLAAISFRRSPEQVADVVLAWQRPDRPFFAAGACHILARQFTRRHPDFRIVQIQPRPGWKGSHLFATDGTRAFDFNGWSLEADLIKANVEASRIESPAWDYRLVPVTGDFDEFCRSINHRTAELYPGDVEARADRFIDSVKPPSSSGQPEKEGPPTVGTDPTSEIAARRKGRYRTPGIIGSSANTSSGGSLGGFLAHCPVAEGQNFLAVPIPNEFLVTTWTGGLLVPIEVVPTQRTNCATN